MREIVAPPEDSATVFILEGDPRTTIRLSPSIHLDIGFTFFSGRYSNDLGSHDILSLI
jgi:hypothetical protein